MEMCPFLSNPLWKKDESGFETFFIKEVPCQKEKCFLYREGRCGAVYNPDYSDIKNMIWDVNLSLNENMKAFYDLIRENSESNFSFLKDLDQRIVFIIDNLKSAFYEGFKGIEEEISKLKSEIKEITSKQDESIKKILDLFIEERDKFLKNFETVFEKIVSAEKEHFDEISRKSISYIENIRENTDKRFSEIFELINKERYLLGEVFEKMKELTEEMASYKKEIEKSLLEERVRRKFESAKFLYLKGEYNDAEKILKEIFEEKEFDDAYLLMGLVLLGKKEFKEAEIYFKNYLEKNPEVPEALTGLGRIFFERGDYENALILLEKAKEKSPDSEDILYIYGLSLARAGKVEEAKEVFEKIININPYFEPAKEAIKKYISPVD